MSPSLGRRKMSRWPTKESRSAAWLATRLSTAQNFRACEGKRGFSGYPPSTPRRYSSQRSSGVRKPARRQAASAWSTSEARRAPGRGPLGGWVGVGRGARGRGVAGHGVRVCCSESWRKSGGRTRPVEGASPGAVKVSLGAGVGARCRSGLGAEGAPDSVPERPSGEPSAAGAWAWAWAWAWGSTVGRPGEGGGGGVDAITCATRVDAEGDASGAT